MVLLLSEPTLTTTIASIITVIIEVKEDFMSPIFNFLPMIVVQNLPWNQFGLDAFSLTGLVGTVEVMMKAISANFIVTAIVVFITAYDLCFQQ